MAPERGLCECGCGESTRLAPRTDRTKGWVKDEPLRFKLGHILRSPSRVEYVVDEATGCWVWQRAIRQPDGYGQGYTDDHRPRLAHRLVYERHRGPIPPGRQLDHLCRNRACVNPDHLELVTNAVNCQRGLRARLTPAAAEHIRRSSLMTSALAKQFGVGLTTIYAVRNGVSWREASDAS